MRSHLSVRPTWISPGRVVDPAWACTGRGLASRRVTATLVRSYRTVSPLPVRRTSRVGPTPSAVCLCATFPRVSPGRRYRPSRPTVSGLSSRVTSRDCVAYLATQDTPRQVFRGTPGRIVQRAVPLAQLGTAAAAPSAGRYIGAADETARAAVLDHCRPGRADAIVEGDAAGLEEPPAAASAERTAPGATGARLGCRGAHVRRS